MKNNYVNGDIVMSGKGYYRVYAVSFPQVLAIQKLSEEIGSQKSVIPTSGTMLNPVVMTDDLLIKIGAGMNNIGWWELDLPDNIGYLSMNPRNGVVWLKHRGSEGVMVNPKTSDKLYLHEIQRLYRGLSGEELVKQIEF